MKKNLALLLLMLVLGSRAADVVPPKPGSTRVTPTVTAVARVLPAVVNISTERMVRSLDPYEELRRRFFGLGPATPRQSLGSGVIVDPSGLLITCEHVIRQASRITVSLADGSEYEAEPLCADAKNDLALLQLSALPKAVPAVAFAIPEDLLLGETVIAVGNPLGYGHSVSVGILSAKGRRLNPEEHNAPEAQEEFDDNLQTDAAINPGNSGGPLINADGELIGLNEAIRADAQGIGFAIPLKRIEEFLCVWLVPSRFGRYQCGIVPGTRVDAQGKPAVYVRKLIPDSPAAKAGVQPDDVIAAVNGQPVRQAIDLSRLLWRLPEGTNVKLKLATGKELAFTITPMPVVSGQELAHQKLKVELEELTPRLGQALRLPDGRGLIITSVERGSFLGRRNIQRGDILKQVDGLPVATFADLHRALSQALPGDVLTIVVDRVLLRQGIIERYTVEVPF